MSNRRLTPVEMKPKKPAIHPVTDRWPDRNHPRAGHALEQSQHFEDYHDDYDSADDIDD